MLDNEILFAKIKDDVKIPTKRDEDAGYDIYACFDENQLVINPNETIMIPTGLCSAFSKKYVAILKERGSTGIKGIGQRAGVIDSGYHGEWMIPITNHNTIPILFTKETNEETLSILAEDYIIYSYSKAICQAVFVEVPKLTPRETTIEEINSITSERGIGKLGSSKK